MPNTTWSATDKTANITLTGSNLIATQSAVGANGGVRSIHRVLTGKYYWECTQTVTTNISTGVGIAASHAPLNLGIGSANTGPSCSIARTSNIWVGTTQVVTGAGTLANGTVVGIALDCDAGLVWFRVAAAGIWNNSATAAPGGSGGIAFGFGGGVTAVYAWAACGAQNDQITANFGDGAFAGAVPAGYTAGFPQTTPTLLAVETGLIRETLYAADGSLRTDGLIREVLRSTGTSGATYIAVDGLVREVLLVPTPPSASTQARAWIMA